ncbi:MAG: hypothetical protein KOO69_00060 [Victivallales bacterium]|nr:hypothetical protein [Victivallales bacterium]
MINFLKDMLTSMNIPVNDFNSGYFFALVVVGLTLLGLFIIRIILKIIFRKKRCHTISINADNGNAFISCSAIMAVIKALEKEFSALTINKVNLFRYGNKPFLEVYLDFDASKGGLPDHAAKFKLRVIESLNALFGIKNIKKVHLHLRHIQLQEADLLNTQKIDAVLDTRKTAAISVGSMTTAETKKEEKAPADKKKAVTDSKAKK